jgi:polyisoprenoid-binding protein YceI
MSKEAPITTTGGEQNGTRGDQLSALAGRWRVSSELSTIGFRVRKMGMYHVKGRFREVEGTAEFGRGSAGVEVMIKASSVSTRMPPRDAHLRSRDFLDVKRYPLIRISASSIETDEGGGLRVPATFELHGTRGTVELTGHAHGTGSPLVLHFAGSLDRHAFGIRARQPFEMVVGSEVLLETELVLDRE